MLHSSEEIERESLEELHSVAPTKVREDLGLVGRNIGSAFVSAASTFPKTAVVLNRTIGVGLGAPETSKSIDQIVDVYRSANVSRYFIQVHPDARPVELEDWLLKQGVTKARAWQKFSRGRDSLRGCEVKGKYPQLIRQLRENKAAMSGVIKAPPFATTYLDDNVRIGRDQDGAVYVFRKSSKNTKPTDFSSIARDTTKII